MHLLHLDSSPRGEESISRRLTRYLRERLAPSRVTYRDLAAEPFPPLAAADLVAVHDSTGVGTEALPQHLALSRSLIDELLSADVLVVGVAMHNFSVPAVLKQWIDYVTRAGYTFRYTDQGPVGLVEIQCAWLVVATGGTPVGGPWDFASGYLNHLFRFIGVRDVRVIDASGSKREPERVLAKARAQIDRLLGT
ncbi:MAG: FMN-dependent NADH-azoreductase 2 [Porticoccaceae bacterium]|nr:MAG: FMN-dependent NADH-azoreductase 2 [Porticoccaceae bacterium]